MTAIERLKAIQARLSDLGNIAKSRNFTPTEMAEIEAKSAEAIELKGKIDRGQASQAPWDALNAPTPDEYKHPDGSWSTTPPFDYVDPSRTKGFMALTGAKGKEFAKGIANEIQKGRGEKAFLVGGTITTPVPLVGDGPIELGKVPHTILDLIATTRRDTPMWKYLRQTVATNNAAIVAPGALKPTSVVTIDDVDGNLEVFAHLSEYVDEYLLRDNSQLSNFLSTQLLWMLQTKVEEEVLNGDGTTGHLTGILNTAGIQTQAFADDKLTTLRTAALKLENLGHTADTFVVNSADWAAIETQRATSGSFDLGGPIDRASQKIWGTQVVTSSRIAAGTALALDLDAVGLDVGAEGVEIKWDSSTGFDKNQIRARVEGRFGVSVFQPSAIVKATLTGE